MENTNGLTIEFMRVLIRQTRDMDLVSLFGLMDENMKGCGNVEECMVKAFS